MHSKRSPMPSRWPVNLARQWATNVNATVPSTVAICDREEEDPLGGIDH